VAFRGALLAGTGRAVEGARAGAGEDLRRVSGDSSLPGTAAEFLFNYPDSVELFSGNNPMHPTETAGLP
jgi:hypothetical protein